MNRRGVRAWTRLLAPFALALAVVGCGGNGNTSDTTQAVPPPSLSPSEPAPVPSVAPSTSTPAPSALPSSSSVPSTRPVPTRIATSTPPPPVVTSTPVPPTISLPPNLCAGTDRAQDAADAYIGALSAGQFDEAQACVLPGAVPTAVTIGLLARQKQTAVYLPVGQGNAPDFTYQGNNKTISVSVTREADGKFWVSKVEVR